MIVITKKDENKSVFFKKRDFIQLIYSTEDILKHTNKEEIENNLKRLEVELSEYFKKRNLENKSNLSNLSNLS